MHLCFVLQDELDMVLSMWNSHRILPGSNGRDLYHGKPFLMYYLPELYQAHNHLQSIDYDKLDIFMQEDICLWKSPVTLTCTSFVF